MAKTKNVLGSEEKIIIEAKFYKKQKISIDVLRRLYAVASIEKVNKVLLITNSELTNSSKKFLAHSYTKCIMFAIVLIRSRYYF